MSWSKIVLAGTAAGTGLLLGLLSSTPVIAAGAYVPDAIEFDGTEGLRFTSHPVLTLPDGGTLEFWIAADWSGDPGYDPVVLANAGPKNVAYLVAFGADRQSLKFQSGGHLGEVAFNFGDGKTHHVAIVDFGDSTFVIVDGQFVGAVAMSLQDLPTETLWLGAGYDNERPFIGVLAGLRIWDLPVGLEVLVDHALKDVTGADAEHPDIEFLVGHSRFDERDFYVSESVVIAKNVSEGEAQ